MLEAELYNVVELVLSGRYQHRTSPSAVPGECPIEVHDLAFWRLAPWGEGPILVVLEAWRLRPFCHEIRQCGSLDDPGCAELELKRLQFYVPLSDPSG